MRLAAVVFLILLACLVWLGGCNHKQGARQREATVIIFRSADGRILTMENLRGVTGTFRWEVVGKTGVPAEAESLHEQGRQAGAAGDYNRALTLLQRASNPRARMAIPDLRHGLHLPVDERRR